jgi:hypothetical protein
MCRCPRAECVCSSTVNVKKCPKSFQAALNALEVVRQTLLTVANQGTVPVCKNDGCDLNKFVTTSLGQC